MADATKIEWCDSTWNSWTGCENVSPACDNCYAEHLMDTRMHRVKWGPLEQRVQFDESTRKRPFVWNRETFFRCDTAGCGWRGTRTMRQGTSCPQCRNLSLHITRRRVFVESLGDVLDNKVPPAWLADLLDTVRLCNNVDFLFLTKRVGAWRRRLEDAAVGASVDGRLELASWIRAWLEGNAPANIWFGITVINQAEADRDIPKLLEVPARVRFLSIEPMLGPIIITGLNTRESYCPLCKAIVSDPSGSPHEATHDVEIGIHYDAAKHCANVADLLHWVIAGGESGRNARPSHPEWYRSLRDQCAAAGVAFLFKQWGQWAPDETRADRMFVYRDGTTDIPDDRLAQYAGNGETAMSPLGKKAAGRLLDGQEYNGFPQQP